MNELNPYEAKALQSSLWELDILKKHYHPKVSKLASAFEESLSRPSFQLEELMDQSYETLMDIEFTSKKGTFASAEGLSRKFTVPSLFCR